MMANETASASSGPTPPPSAIPVQEIKNGTEVGGRFIVLGELGKGGMGVVHRAFDERLERTVALKFVRPDKSGAGGSLLEKEARSMAQLNHPNVVVVHDVGQYVGQIFIAMEFMGGGSLRAWLEREKRGWETIVELYAAAGEGLYAAHQSGKIHRDFKADNVLLDEAGRPHVTDFGLAVDAALSTGTGGDARKNAGTPGYLAPEVLRGDASTVCSDQFSFCVALYRSLYGELPFGTDTKPPLVVPAPPARASVPQWVRRVVLRGLKERPEERFPSMRELLDALGENPLKKWRQRGLIAAIVVLLSLIIGAAVAYRNRKTPRELEEQACRLTANDTAQALLPPERAAGIKQAFVTANPANGAADFDRVLPRLQNETTSWRELSLQTCAMAQPVERERRQSCLDDRRKKLQLLVSLLVTADPKVEEHALSTALSQEPSSSCLDDDPVDARLTEPRGHDDPLDDELAQARLLLVIGEYDEAINTALGVSDDAQKKNAIGVQADAQLLLGEIFTELYQAKAGDYLKKSIRLSEELGRDRERVQAWLTFSKWYTRRGERHWLDARDALQNAGAILKRVDDPLLQASYATQQGRLAQARGDIDEARVHFRTALERLRRKLKDENHPLISTTKSNLALVLEPDEGLPMLSSVLDSVTTLYGSEHPEVAAAWHSLGLMKTYDSDCQGALDAFDAAIELEKKRPYDKARLGRSRAAKSAALDTVCHRPAEALTECRLASTLLEENGAPDDERIRQLKVCKQLMCALNAPPAELQKIHKQIVDISGSEEDDRTTCK